MVNGHQTKKKGVLLIWILLWSLRVWTFPMDDFPTLPMALILEICSFYSWCFDRYLSAAATSLQIQIIYIYTIYIQYIYIYKLNTEMSLSNRKSIPEFFSQTWGWTKYEWVWKKWCTLCSYSAWEFSCLEYPLWGPRHLHGRWVPSKEYRTTKVVRGWLCHVTPDHSPNARQVGNHTFFKVNTPWK